MLILENDDRGEAEVKEQELTQVTTEQVVDKIPEIKPLTPRVKENRVELREVLGETGVVVFERHSSFTFSFRRLRRGLFGSYF